MRYSSAVPASPSTAGAAEPEALLAIVEDLIGLLRLERIEQDIFRGDSRDIGSAQVFGGQVIGQALSAAQHTVDDRIAHSLHAYFLRRGDVEAPIVYEVDRQRDGGSFSSRRVVAIQHGRPILNLAASFQKPESGLEHQSKMPDVPGPDGLRELAESAREMLEKFPQKMRRFLLENRAFEFRHVEPLDFKSGSKREPLKHVWVKAVDRLPDDPALHQNMLTYVSDHELIGTATLPHGLTFFRGNVIMASLDHALWFHRPLRVDEWLLYAIDSPNSAAARGFARGQFFTQSGELVASTAQEGLMRVVDSSRSRPRSDPKQQA